MEMREAAGNTNAKVRAKGELPAAVAGRRRGECRYRGERNLADCVVLCAQPDAALRSRLIDALHGVRVVPAMSGLEALSAIDTALFNVYVLDYSLPDWTGLGLCLHIRRRDRLSPICFFTTAPDSACRHRAVECGADIFLSHELDPPALRQELEAALRFRTLRLTMRARLDD